MNELSIAYMDYFTRYLTGLDIEGSTLLASSRAMTYIGVCKEVYWPSENIGIQPNEGAVKDGMTRQGIAYIRLHSIEDIKTAIIKHKSAVSLSFEIFDNISYADNNGIVPLPEITSKKKGVHAVAIIGYNNNPYTYYNGAIEVGFFKFANSWGEKWGDNGYGYIPFSYIEKYGIELIMSINQHMFFKFLKSEWLYEITYNGDKIKLWFGVSKCYTASYQNVYVITLFKNGVKLGWLIASKVGNTTIEIIDFFVWPDYRFKGYGSIILREFIRQEYIWGSSIIFHWISKKRAVEYMIPHIRIGNEASFFRE